MRAVTAARETTRFRAALGGMLVLALGLRLWYALGVAPGVTVGGDGKTYHWLANLIADGHGFIRPWDFQLFGVVKPTAEHPPLYPLLLAGVSKLGATSWEAHRVASCFMGTATVGVVGLVGRRAGGPAAGIAAAALAAVYPLLVLADGTLYSESLYGLTIALTLLAGYRFLDRPTAWRAALLGAAIALAVLTRAEALLLYPLLVLPLAWLAREARWRNLAVAGVVLALLLTPWLVRNWITFDRPVFSTNLGGLLAGANCDATYHGDFTGLWRYDCFGTVRQGDEPYEADQYRDRGLRYARDHAGRLAVVAPIRVLRTWDVWKPRQAAGYESFVEGRELWWERAGTAFYVLLVAPLALIGAILLRRRRQTLRVLLAPALLVTISSTISYGITRFRMAADVALVVSAGVALAALIPQLARLPARRAKRTTPARS
jgi:4-amino-4-deoxy-L-arabinose transferase-like glycosyltransferase